MREMKSYIDLLKQERSEWWMMGLFLVIACTAVLIYTEAPLWTGVVVWLGIPLIVAKALVENQDSLQQERSFQALVREHGLQKVFQEAPESTSPGITVDPQIGKVSKQVAQRGEVSIRISKGQGARARKPHEWGTLLHQISQMVQREGFQIGFPLNEKPKLNGRSRRHTPK